MNFRLLLYSIILSFAFLGTGVKGQRLDQLLELFPLPVGNRWQVLPSPNLSFSPETSWSMGFSTIGIHHSQGRDGGLVSTIQLDLTYTLNRQRIADLDYHWKESGGNWIFQGSNSWYDYPDTWYALSGASEPISYRRIELDNQVYRRLGNKWFGGLFHHAQLLSQIQYESGGLFDQSRPTGFLGGVSNGLGLALFRDQRINPLNPVSGGDFLLIKTGFYDPLLGSDFSFIRHEVDWRHYFGLAKPLVLAVQLKGTVIDGDAPFRMLANLGGSGILRGYHARMFTGNLSLAVQSELRWKLSKHWGWVVFAGMGSTDDKAGLRHPVNIHYAGGTGIRFTLDQLNLNNLRVDLAVGEKGLTWYFSYGEAF